MYWELPFELGERDTAETLLQQSSKVRHRGCSLSFISVRISRAFLGFFWRQRSRQVSQRSRSENFLLLFWFLTVRQSGWSEFVP